LEHLLVNRVDLLTPDQMLAYLAREEASPEQKEAAQDYGKTIAIYLRGYGNTANVKTVEGEEPGRLALLENRNINPWTGKKTEQGINVDQAKVFALGYFDWLKAIKDRRALLRRV
jgi:hypothetical protein